MPNYDVLESTGSYHGTDIRSKPPTEQYKSNWDLIWGKEHPGYSEYAAQVVKRGETPMSEEQYRKSQQG